MMFIATRREESLPTVNNLNKYFDRETYFDNKRKHNVWQFYLNFKASLGMWGYLLVNNGKSSKNKPNK